MSTPFRYHITKKGREALAAASVDGPPPQEPRKRPAAPWPLPPSVFVSIPPPAKPELPCGCRGICLGKCGITAQVCRDCGWLMPRRWLACPKCESTRFDLSR